MAQLSTESSTQRTNEGEEEQSNDNINLQTHLTKHGVVSKIYNLLQEESITLPDLLTFTIEDLKDWCNEHSLKTIERRRFINAIKALPNAEEAKSIAKPQIQIQKEIVKVYIDKEEKEQMKQFDEMKTNINTIMNNIESINKQKKENTENIIKEINNVCDKIQTFVESLRKNLLQKVS